MSNMTKTFIIGLLVGLCLIFTTSLFASSQKEFILTEARYPIFVNGNLYQGDLPILNLAGHTYIPLRAVSNLLGSTTTWNETLRQVEITFGSPSIENSAFRNIVVFGSKGTYTVVGEARVFEATVQYEVEDGHVIFLEGFETARIGAPDWGVFTIDIHIPEESLPNHGQLTLILFEESAKDGSRLNELSVPLESF